MSIQNPYTPGAGHPPPYLAGRTRETEKFRRLLAQRSILENPLLTGLRGVGKTVLLERFKPLAQELNRLWVGTDLSETASLTTANLATRILTDLAVVTSPVQHSMREIPRLGFGERPLMEPVHLDIGTLNRIFQSTPGLVEDKLKAVLELAWSHLEREGYRGLVFAYDEAQNLADHAKKEEFPLSVLLDVFQSLQRKQLPLMLVLTGLPTLFPKLVEARTFAERMFHVLQLDRLTDEESREAIEKPVAGGDLQFAPESVALIADAAGGYPYFVQFICREAYDTLLSRPHAPVPLEEIVCKLDNDFFAGRWARATDRQRDLLGVIAMLDNANGEFTVQEIVEQSKRRLEKPFGASHVNQMLVALAKAGLIYKNRHGRYSFAVPLMGEFIRRTMERE